LSPRDPHLWTFHLTRAYAHFALGECEAAEHFARRAVEHPNATHVAHAALLASLGRGGNTEQCEQARRALLQKRPGYTRATGRSDLFFCADEFFIEAFLEGLSQAGVPA
jgi:hypothetical protein